MPATAAFFNHFAPKIIRSLGLSSGQSRGQMPLDADPHAAPQLPRSSWRAPAAWNDSELLRSAASQEQEKGDRADGETVTREISESTQGGVEGKLENGPDWRQEINRL